MKKLFLNRQSFRRKKYKKKKLKKHANQQRTQLNSYCNNKVKRIDLETLAKICCVLDCRIEDIMEYVR
ncbi:helix-turn-helix domain-containing protein [Peptoniphilus sp. SGI.035]|uniref:helix-turn-helix domain-containing protein n=1 Tax=Peptoniphilus sp. SGI.035 TaxID=3420564 RepID=UPI003D06A679